MGNKPSAFSVQLTLAAAKMAAKYEDQREQDFRFLRQFITDLSQIALEDAFGDESKNMVKPFVDALQNLHDEFADIWNADSDDVEYSLSILDRRLKAICGDKFIPQEDRYEGILFRGHGIRVEKTEAK